ncbi:hypothetical protein M569_16169, partial [Genlisea aurea]
LYRIIPSTVAEVFLKVSWERKRGSSSVILTISVEGGGASTGVFDIKLKPGSPLLKGDTSFTSHVGKISVSWNLAEARYGPGPEPVAGFYVMIGMNSEVGLVLGDMLRVSAARSALVRRSEHFSGKGGVVYETLFRFSDGKPLRNVAIAVGENGTGFRVYVDSGMKVEAHNLTWNFRGNQTFTVDGSEVEFMWNAHDWFFGSGQEPRIATFSFRVTKGSDEISLFIYGCKD